MLALGVKPVGVRDFIGTFDEDDRVWARDLYAGATPEKVGGDELELEKVAALRPDLIMGVYSFMDEAMYEKLSQIAPTVAPTKATAVRPLAGPDADHRSCARARASRRRRSSTGVEGRFAEAREEHPEFDGKTLAYALGGEGGANTYSLEATDLRTQLFTGARLRDAAGDRRDQPRADEPARRGRPRDRGLRRPQTTCRSLPQLDAVEQGRNVNLGDFDTEVNGAIGYSSPLSLPAGARSRRAAARRGRG